MEKKRGEIISILLAKNTSSDEEKRSGPTTQNYVLWGVWEGERDVEVETESRIALVHAWIEMGRGGKA